MDAFGVFEGGGAKGVAHIGALKAAEERHVKFLGVAGTSAGAIIAALVAAGYTADEIYSPGPPRSGLFAHNLLRFLDETQWKRFRILIEDGEKSFRGCQSWADLWWASTRFACRNRRILTEIFTNRGFFQAEKFRRWTNLVLQRKLAVTKCDFKPTGPGSTVAFRDLNVPLKLIVADISNRRVKIYSSDKTPAESVSHAIAASVSIPLFFRPRSVENAYLVDGGIVSNFPAWVFDRERQGAPPLTPSFGSSSPRSNPTRPKQQL